MAISDKKVGLTGRYLDALGIGVFTESAHFKQDLHCITILSSGPDTCEASLCPKCGLQYHSVNQPLNFNQLLMQQLRVTIKKISWGNDNLAKTT